MKSNGIKICVIFLFVWLALIVVGSGCATAPDTSKPPQIVFEKSKQALGTNHVVLFWFPLRLEPIAKASFLITSSTIPHHGPANLSRFLSAATDHDISVAVAGLDSRITRQFIIDALSPQTNQLPGLRLAFIGDVADRDIVRAAVEKHGGKFFFEQYDEQSDH